MATANNYGCNYSCNYKAAEAAAAVVVVVAVGVADSVVVVVAAAATATLGSLYSRSILGKVFSSVNKRALMFRRSLARLSEGRIITIIMII